MLDILFIHPNASRKTYQDLSRDFSAIEPPVWSLMLAKHTITKGYRTELIDAEAKRMSANQITDAIKELNPRLVCIVVYGQQPSASAQNMQGVHDILENLKGSYPHFKTLIIGLYPSAVPRKTMSEEKTDFVSQGEGPKTIQGLLELSDLDDVNQLTKVQDLWFRNDGHIRFSFKGNNIENLDVELPGFAWELIDFKDYRTATWHSYANETKKSPFAYIYMSFGCPYKCEFCCINASFGDNNVET